MKLTMIGLQNTLSANYDNWENLGDSYYVDIICCFRVRYEHDRLDISAQCQEKSSRQKLK